MNNFTFEQLIKVIETSKSSEVRHIEMPGLKLTFRYPCASKAKPHIETQAPLVHVSESYNPMNMTNEELLMYATPRFDELQAEKKAHQEKLAGEVHGV